MIDVTREEIDTDPKLIAAYNMGYETGAYQQIEDGYELSFRDEVAIAALNGLLANPNRVGSREEFEKMSYEIADKMCVVRDGK